jgi:Flagellin and related hook-associated proteins
MPLYINTNTSSLNAQRQLMSSGQALDKAMTRLSSGMRINSAADDAAGLAISNRQTSQIRGLNQAVRNANDGISMIQTAEGAISESTNILQRMRELAVQSSNGIYSDTDRATLDAEVQQLVSELDRIAKTTTFNGQNILDGSLKKVDLQVGANAKETISMSIQSVDAKTLGMGSTSVDLMGGESDLNSLSLVEGDILINGQSIVKGTETWDGSVATDTDQKLLDLINKNVNGVTASTYAVSAATAAGDGVLADDESVSVALGNLDGTTTTITIGGGTSSLQELVDKMNAQGGGKFSVSISEDGKASISAENVSSITVTDTVGALGTGINGTAASARITLKADNGDPVTVTRGSTGTLEQLADFGFRENDVAGQIEGHAVDANALAVGDLKINGVNVGASESGGLQDKIKAINAVSDQTGVTAKAFTSVSLDFGSVALSTLVGGTIAMNGVDVEIDAGAAGTKLSDVAAKFNEVTDQTGITATVSGTRIILEGNVAQIGFSTGIAAGGAAPTAALVDGGGAVVQLALAGDESSAADIEDDSVAAGGIQLTSNNGSPISVDVKDAAAEAKTGLIDSNVMGGGAFGTAIANISISTQQGAQKALGVIDNALETVNDIRSQLGAVNNRLDFTVSNLSNVVENTQAARARITDADFAAETAALSRAQVLQQASQAMLAQANARPQQVLSLLQ